MNVMATFFQGREPVRVSSVHRLHDTDGNVCGNKICVGIDVGGQNITLHSTTVKDMRAFAAELASRVEAL